MSDLSNQIKLLAEGQLRQEPIYQSVDGWIIEYPDIEELAQTQSVTYWPFTEYDLTNDVQDLRVNCTDAERKALIEVLRLFTHYELRVGEDYWGGRFAKMFPRPEFQRAASIFFAVELNSHAPFYNEINKVLYIDTPEFYSEWRQDPDLRKRMGFIGKMVGAEDDLVSMAAFTFIEGVILYSSFAFLKHFQAQEAGAKNLFTTLNRGINQSVADENLHAVAGATAFSLVMKERSLSESDKQLLHDIIKQVAEKTYEHESVIIDKIFSHGEIQGINELQMKDFIKHRINYCLNNLGIGPIYDESKLDDSIKNWFYRGINSIQFHDFFSGGGSEYHISWNKERFGQVWNQGNAE